MSDEKKELQKRYVELQLIDAQVNQIQKQIQLLDNQLMELDMINASLDDFGEIKAGTEILTSLAPGIYTKAELKDNEELIVNVGSNVVVKKNISETKRMINNQMDEMRKLQEQVIAELNRLILKANSIEQEINDIASKKE